MFSILPAISPLLWWSVVALTSSHDLLGRLFLNDWVLHHLLERLFELEWSVQKRSWIGSFRSGTHLTEHVLDRHVIHEHAASFLWTLIRWAELRHNGELEITEHGGVPHWGIIAFLVVIVIGKGDLHHLWQATILLWLIVHHQFEAILHDRAVFFDLIMINDWLVHFFVWVFVALQEILHLKVVLANHLQLFHSPVFLLFKLQF